MMIGLAMAVLVLAAGVLWLVYALIRQQVTQLTQRLTHDLEQRQQQQQHNELKAASAAQRLQEDFGAVKTHIANLQGLQREVTELNNLLKPQQVRGKLGEFMVGLTISDLLPQGHYAENHTFADGKQVEFVLKLSDRLIPVDAKLPLDAYKRMRDTSDPSQRQAARSEFKRVVRKKIDEVKDYIRPQEGTFSFAVMVIPSEAVYYDLIAGEDFTADGGLDGYARERSIFLTSPNTFWAYVVTIAQGLRGLEIGRQAEQILASLQSLAGKIHSFTQDDFRTLGGHLADATKKYDEAKRRLHDMDEEARMLERAESKPLEQIGEPR